MSTKVYSSASELIKSLSEHGSIHVECNREKSEEFLNYVIEKSSPGSVAFVTLKDKGYDRMSVREYVRFFHDILDAKESVESVMEQFGLGEIKGRKMNALKPGDYVKVGIARVSMQRAGVCFLEEPLLNLSEPDMKRVLTWVEQSSEEGVHFITTNSSLRHALLMPGTAFYIEDDRFHEVEHEEEEEDTGEQEMEILKIPAKSGNSTLLFEPKDIDYIESLNKCTYLSVRGTLFQTQQTMYELEETLKKSGFFRCHRSYLVNVQKVERFEKWTKNSYVLILNNAEHSQIPLSKGRIEDMKETFHW
ncbi:LytTR family transcriptional regulator DNA-binding domain-containing protein [Roseburia hominis]